MKLKVWLRVKEVVKPVSAGAPLGKGVYGSLCLMGFWGAARESNLA